VANAPPVKSWTETVCWGSGRNSDKVAGDVQAAVVNSVGLGRPTVGILYETGVAGTYETIVFRRVPLEELDQT
jgi:sialidase-1